MSDKNPKISVLIPAYNSGEYLGTAIRSILMQTFNDFEIVIVDDGSKDDTWRVIRRYAKGHPDKIFICRNEKNKGISFTRNRLVSLARGEYVAWQDADDISMPTRLERQLDLLEKNPEVGMTGGYLELFDEAGTLSVRKYAAHDSELRKNIFKFSPVSQGVAMIRTKCLREVEGYDGTKESGEDLCMSFKIGVNYKFANVQKVLLKYRQHGKSITHRKLMKTEKNTLEIRKKYSSGHIYKMTPSDRLYNFLHRFSIYVIPSRIKIQLFSFFRDQR